MRTLEAPTVNRVEFERLCDGLDEFEPLPDHTTSGLVREAPTPDGEQEPTALDELILAGLVTPV